jgi:hypothetical protein
MKNLLLLFLAVVPSLMSGQSIELLPFACEAETLASVSVGPYQQMVAFSVSVPPGTQWELRSCADGVCHFERMVSSTLADTLVIEHSSTYPGPPFPDNYSLNLQIKRGSEVFVSQIFGISGFEDPSTYAGGCTAVDLTTTISEVAKLSGRIIAGDGTMFLEPTTTVSISDSSGRLLSRLSGKSGRQNLLQELPPGMYLISLTEHGLTHTERLMKE